MAMSPERKAERAAARKREKELEALKPIAKDVLIVETPKLAMRDETHVRLYVDGVTIEGEISKFNAVIEKLGYRPVRITSNMLNPKAGEWCIDINTPAYCDPGRESYHSM